MFINDTLFCCLSQEKQDRIKTDIHRGDYRTIYLNQKNLIEEKDNLFKRIREDLKYDGTSLDITNILKLYPSLNKEKKQLEEKEKRI